MLVKQILYAILIFRCKSGENNYCARNCRPLVSLYLGPATKITPSHGYGQMVGIALSLQWDQGPGCADPRIYLQNI
ncbi:hypothetical protein V6N12_075413 [Hibiscus sabdariffa]|uniref:Uncharacterized protein n=1 Tax=Hibiscus sabdariffa TaxID=183260 RepID=A0ABR2C7J4_9ROSI